MKKKILAGLQPLFAQTANLKKLASRRGSGRAAIIKIIIWVQVFAFAAAFGLAGTKEAAAAEKSPYAGIYTGSFSGPFNNGHFAILVKENGTAILTAYDQVDFLGFGIDNVVVNANGSFSAAIDDGWGSTLSGTLTPSGVSGTYSDFDGSGTFTGTKRPTTGPFSNSGGYYAGTLSGSFTFDGIFLGSSSGLLLVIVAADGVGFVYAIVSGVINGDSFYAESGGLISIASNGNINSTLLDGPQITGTVNPQSLSASGNFFATEQGAIHSGTWTTTRQLPLPDPNRAPVAANDNYEMYFNRTLTVAAPGVLGNDSDADGDPLTAGVVSGPSNGVVSLNGNGGFSYTPNRGFRGSDSFTYQAHDGAAGSNPAAVAITVKNVPLVWLPVVLSD